MISIGILKFVKGKNHSVVGLKKVIDYITKEEKTDICLTYGQHCNPQTAYMEMLNTKMIWNKEEGVQYKHLIQSFADYDNITPEQAYEIGQKFLEHPLFSEFQVLMAVHRDKEHIHIHYAINTVNTDNGKKWNQRKEDLDSLRDYNDKLCQENGLVAIPKNHKGKGMSDGEYHNTKKGTSWKHELWLTVRECMKYAADKDDFIKKMEQLGYKVNWTDARKYITFETPQGKKCRNNKLYPPERFAKEAMEDTFHTNRKYQQQEMLNNNFEMFFKSISFLMQQEDDIGHFYPLSKLEGEALHEYIEEQKKGVGIDILER